jgi:lysophospholipid acyltransferase (LPLAT)-like uncharacterized protein
VAGLTDFLRGKDAMKIRNRRLVGAAGWLATKVARTLFRTLRLDYTCLGPPCDPDHAAPDDRLAYSTWHENLLLPTVVFGRPSVRVLISEHADGELLASLIRAVGMGMVRGSTNRGGVKALRKLVTDDSSFRHLAVTPDGPRGPRRVVQPGLVYVASRNGMKIVPLGVGYARPWRLGSWDRFAIPKPCSRARCIFSAPITVPPGLRAAELETYRLLVQEEMDRVNAVAQNWADTGRLVLPPAAAEPRKLAS